MSFTLTLCFSNEENVPQILEKISKVVVLLQRTTSSILFYALLTYVRSMYARDYDNVVEDNEAVEIEDLFEQIYNSYSYLD